MIISTLFLRGWLIKTGRSHRENSLATSFLTLICLTCKLLVWFQSVQKYIIKYVDKREEKGVKLQLQIDIDILHYNLLRGQYTECNIDEDMDSLGKTWTMSQSQVLRRKNVWLTVRFKKEKGF